MAARRKDPKGRVLKEGESYRKSDNLYMFRYRDIRRKTRAVYAKDLRTLRKKERVIKKQIDDGIDYSAGEITVIELVKKYNLLH